MDHAYCPYSILMPSYYDSYILFMQDLIDLTSFTLGAVDSGSPSNFPKSKAFPEMPGAANYGWGAGDLV